MPRCFRWLLCTAGLLQPILGMAPNWPRSGPGRRSDLSCALAFLFVLGSLASGLAAGSGLTGEYFDNLDFTNLKFTRTDPTVDFNWDTAAPTNSMGADAFSVRWSGQIEPRYSEIYTFYITAEDGARLWVNERLVVARTTSTDAALEMSGRIALQAGQRYNLVLEYMENTGSARVSLSWSSASQAKEIVPQGQLYPTTGLPERGSIRVEHWMNLPGTNISALTSSPNYPNKPDGREFVTSFECLQPGWGDNYGTRVTGFIVPPTNGNYLFAVSGDDVVELFLSANTNAVNKKLIASNTAPTGFRQFTNSSGQISAPITLLAQQEYYVELLHKEGTGDDHFSVAWQPPDSTTFTVIPADALVPTGLHQTPPAQANFLDTLAPNHPRLLASPERFEWLKRTVASNSVPLLVSWWATISNSANSILAQPVSVYVLDNRGNMLDVSRSVLDRVYKLALAYRMTGNTNFSERAWTELEQVASTNFPDWDPAHFLDTAEMTHACAVGYDWLYDYWTQARRDTIRNAIITKGLNQSLILYTNNSGWTAATANNWNLVCNGGMILGALAVGTESEPLSKYILSKAVASASQVMRHYTTDNGGWYEGPGYWDYTTSYNMNLMAGLESALGSDFGLSDTRAVWETGMFPLYMVGPTKISFNFADASAGNMRGPQLLWVARRYNRPEYAWHERSNASPEVLDLLWYDARGIDPQSTGLQPDNYFRGPTGTTPYFPADTVTMRGHWQDSDATFVSFKAGEIGASHGHLDAGSFVLDALGVRWAHDLGSDDYALPGYFSNLQRWTYYRLRAEGHNTLVINPGTNADQVVDAELPVILYTSEPNAERSAVVADLTSAYGLTRVWRGLTLFNLRRQVLVQDEIQAASPATVWWFMHVNTNTTAQIETNGAAVMLTQGSDRLWVKLLSGNGTFTISNAVPLSTSPNPSGQNSNANYKKLVLNLTGVTNTTVGVLMVPLTTGEVPPTILPTLVSLSDWGAVGVTKPVAASASLTTPEEKPVDLDLRTLTFESAISVEQLGFAVSSATNGVVALLSDGHTARFTPATNYCGAASFSFSVTDTQASPQSASNSVSVAVTGVNDPPLTSVGATNTSKNTFVDFDLWTLANDVETAQSNLLFTVSDPINGTVTLSADGHTARFVPATNFTGAAGFKYTVTDLGEDLRARVHYSFAPPEDLAGNQVNDDTGNGHAGTLTALGTGSFALATNTPPALTGQPAASLRLNELGTNGAARLQCSLDTGDFNLSDNSWTVSGWIQRFATTNDDFIFYLGGGDGFGGNGDEFQFYCPSGANTVRVRHYNTSNTLDVDIVSGSSIGAGQWHHAALTFERTGTNTGTLRLYADGALAATANNLTWGLAQTKPLVFGGHNFSSKLDRYWNGRLTDLGLFTNALTSLEVSRLVTRSITRFAGLLATNTMTVMVSPYTAPTLRFAAFSNDVLSLKVIGQVGPTYLIKGSTNLVDWVTWFTTNPSALPFTWTDTNTADFPAKFYRVQLGP